MSAESLLMYTTADAAKILSVSPSYLEKLRVTGGGPEFIKLGGAVRYAQADLAEWVNARRRASTSDQGTAA